MRTSYTKIYTELEKASGNDWRTEIIYTKMRNCFLSLWERRKVMCKDRYFMDAVDYTDNEEYVREALHSIKMGTKSPKLKLMSCIFSIPVVRFGGFIETERLTERIGDGLHEMITYCIAGDPEVKFILKTIHTGFTNLLDFQDILSFENSKYSGLHTSTYIFLCKNREVHYFSEFRKC